MSEDSRTLLKQKCHEGKGNLVERTSYSIIANKLVGMGGACSNKIYAKKFNDGDYLIMDNQMFHNREVPLAIVNDRHSFDQVLGVLYEKALEVAIKRAEFDDNDFLDLTGHDVPIPEEAKYYIEKDEKLPVSKQ